MSNSKFYADLHIHSRFSRATSRSLNLTELSTGAEQKGLAVIGTGDFTHPQWINEIEEELAPAEPGMFRLKSGGNTRFVLTAEISTIYKDAGAVRKVHHLLMAPDIETVRKINKSLAAIGNIVSDGRPILGISSRNLLEIVLSASDQACIIPAHIWTPWFSALGSKSGYDSIADCYQDLSPHIFAVETGLSSDPLMNYQVSSLDGYHLISNSDAHSVQKLAREATVFSCGMDYYAMLQAMKTGAGLEGTIEFFPEEGKYHLDGHRDCGVVLEPEETQNLNSLCPVCGKALTVGVLNRVHALADRAEGQPETAKPFLYSIPLIEILSEVLMCTPSSGKAKLQYESLVKKLGPELPILLEIGPEDIEKSAGPALAQAITRMREGRVSKEAGYDGSFGRIKVFMDGELDLLFDIKPARRRRAKVQAGSQDEDSQDDANPHPAKSAGLNPAQQEAATFENGVRMVIAGPGTGKTRVLSERIRHLLERSERSILALTFTTRACEEIRERVADPGVDIFTFHALASRILRDAGRYFTVADEDMLEEKAQALGMSVDIRDLVFRLSTAAELDEPQQELLLQLRSQDILTYEGLIQEALTIVSDNQSPSWDHILVDEFQDINPLQMQFLRALAKNSRSLKVIGDPHQAIYGFRGSSAQAFDDFQTAYPEAQSITLNQTYRLTGELARAANSFIGEDRIESPRKGKHIHVYQGVRTAGYIANRIEELLGGLSHRKVDSKSKHYAPSQIAVIVRTRTQMGPFMDALAKASIPFDSAYARPLSATAAVRDRLALISGEQPPWKLVRGVGNVTIKAIEAGNAPDAHARNLRAEAASFLGGLSGSISERLSAIHTSGLFTLPVLSPEHVFHQHTLTFGDDIDAFLNFCRLESEYAQGETVRVLTAHAAKGLEFGCVFVAGMFPLPGMPYVDERNLFYVAMTRAIDQLYLCCGGDFVQSLPAQLIRTITEKKPAGTSEQMSLF